MADIKDYRITEKKGYTASLKFYSDSLFTLDIERHIVRELSDYVIHLTFNGEGWLRITGVDLVVNGGDKITIDDVSRRVGRQIARQAEDRGSNAFAEEECYFKLQGNVVQLLKNCTALQIFVKSELVRIVIDVDKSGIRTVKDFFKTHPLIKEDFDIRKLKWKN